MKLNHFSERILFCKLCGKEFKPKSSRQLFCCPDHTRQAHKHKSIAVREVRNCEWCDKEYLTVQSNQRFCSSHCRIKWYNKNTYRIYRGKIS